MQLKAAFLLMVFALNTVVGFACSVGVNMGFNSQHHNHEEATEAVVNVHNDGKQHVHGEKKDCHGHDESTIKNKSGDSKNDCCNGPVKSFNQLDKSRADVVSIIPPVFFTPFLASNYNSNIFPHPVIVKYLKPFLRSYHPPIPDIRIAIQSFQI